MKNNTKLLSILALSFFCITLLTQCAEEAKSAKDAANTMVDETAKAGDKVADKAGDMADEAGKMVDDAAKKVEGMTEMDSKEGTLSFDKGSWADNVLQGISSGNTTVFTLDQIPYDGGDDLSADGAKQLDNLAEILKANPDWSIEVQGHTEKANNAVGSGKKKATSKVRAAWVQAKMNLRGIKGKQISSKGYGDENLLPNIDEKDDQHKRITIALTKGGAEA